MYEAGRGVAKDPVAAIQWYRKAGEQGHAPSLFNIGRIYSQGTGVPQDYVEGHKWINVAVALASGEDQKKMAAARDGVERLMTADQLAEAHKRARAWMDAYEKREK
jgi:TPR repeat protein